MIDRAHFLARCLRYRFRTESLQLRTLMKLRLRGSTVIDIGANKGIYSFWMSRAVGGSGRVLAFEPQPEMASYIADKRSAFRLSNVSIYNIALSNERGRTDLARSKVGDGSASLQPERSKENSDRIAVDILPLDEVCDAPNVAFVKCDVEGHEIKVFEGARKLLERERPVVQFEATPDEAPSLFDLFHGLGYSGIMFMEGGYRPLSDLSLIPHRKFGLTGHRDFLFFPPQAIGAVIPHRLSSEFPL